MADTAVTERILIFRWIPHACVFLGMLLLSALCVEWVDRPVMYYFHGLSQQADMAWAYEAASAIGMLGKPQGWLALFIGMLVWRLVSNRKDILQSLPVHALAAILVSTVLVRLGKLIASRTRPSDLLEAGLYDFYWSFEKAHNGFPSGHSSLIASIMLVLAYHYPRWRYVCYAVAAAVALSRIVQIKHYTSDSLMGLYIGVISAAMAWKFLTMWHEKRGQGRDRAV